MTPELRRTLIGAISIGTPLKTALQFVGLSDEVIYTWRNRAEAAKKVAHPTKETQDIVEFFGEIDRALAEATIRAQRGIAYLFSQDMSSLTPEQQRIALQAAQFHLTHRNSADYNTKVTTEITGPEGGPVQVSGRVALEMLRELADG